MTILTNRQAASRAHHSLREAEEKIAVAFARSAAKAQQKKEGQ